MCGIYGVISLNQQPIQDINAIVERGVELLKHRGPDEYGVEAKDTVCFGHARLSIIDIEGGHQPMWDSNKHGMITYNGEIYNFLEIQRELKKLGYIFNTRSDTEVVLNAFLEWGADCVNHFRGMFAFVAVDFRKNKVIIVRDRVGIKPLFYMVKNNLLFFSSELEPLYQTIGSLKIDLESLDNYLYWQYIPAPQTIYKDVNALSPAHFIEIDLSTGNITQECYWQLHFRGDHSLSIEDWEHCLDEQLKEAVEIRLMSDVPFGVFLSGGVDSSLITGYMAEILDQPVKTFSIGFKESNYSELAYAQKVAKLNRAEHYAEIVEASSLSLLPFLVRHYGQPFADSSAIPTYYVARMAHKNVKMVLSGDGGDENFAGYNTYPTIVDKSQNTDEAFYWHCLNYKHFLPQERQLLFRSEYKNVVRSYALKRRALMDIEDQPLISRLQYLDIMTYLPFDILTKVDIASMANSLEVRVPFLDHILMETIAKVPAKFKFRKTETGYDKKYILKNIAKKRYPVDIINRSKMGFGVPLGLWFATKMKNEIQKKLLRSPYLPLFFNMKFIETILNTHSKVSDHSAKLWNLLFLEEWMHSHCNSL